jgi:hypothetical protein|tara:strand:- start:2311 stop:2892 length:582 start_codon:yes stop_codon:yes gene_type:complete
MAGGEFDLPVDRPSCRIDGLGSASSYNFVGGLGIDTGSSNYFGTGVALSPHWVLTAGHNVDFDDNGSADPGLTIEINLPRFGSYAVDSYQTTPDFSGFGNPTVHNDLSLLYFDTPLPNLAFPSLGLSMGIGDTLTLAEGYGGLFGDTGGGVALNDQWDWIFETTDLTAVPEPEYYGLLAGLMVFFARIVVRRK